MSRIAIFAKNIEMDEAAHSLAKQLQLPIATSLQDDKFDYLLVSTPDYLGLQKTSDKKLAPFYIDFVTGKLAYRSQQASRRKEMLARAIGSGPKDNPTIIDATAGLGRDSFILATLGYRVTMLERSPILHALLSDALRRAKQHPDTAATAERLQLIHANAIDWLPKQQTQPDIIYLDPMFPDRKKSASVKKEMVITQKILGKDEDANDLFQIAFHCAKKRIVVKRPRLAITISEQKPSFSLTGKSSRFDIYLV